MFSAVEMTYLLVIIFTTYPTNVLMAIKLFSRKELTFCYRVESHLPVWVFVRSAHCAKSNKRFTIDQFIVFKVCFVGLVFCEEESSVSAFGSGPGDLKTI